MWRILFYIIILAAAAFGAVWISNLPGEVTIRVLGQDASPPLSVVVALLLAAGFVIAFAWWLIFTIIRLPSRVGRASRARRRNKGLAALSRGMIAVGAGDSGEAQRHAREAHKLLGEEPLTLLLNAQVAQVAGDPSAAEKAFRKMTSNKDTRLIGLRGLFIEARRQGDQADAYRHAREAVQLAPAVGWANEAVLEAQCAEGAWDDALAMIDKRVSFGLIDRETAKRHRAVLLTADALAHEQSAPDKAFNDVWKALKLAPTLAPAAVLAGRLLGQRNEVRKAAKILENAWAAEPHPDIADAYIHLRLGDSAQDRMKRAEVLSKLANWHPEARLALAQTALDAREFARARETIAPLLSDRPTIRACLLMADIEQAEHGAIGHVREWVARAARAPRDPAWMADGVIFDHWAPFSPVTGSLDAFRWQSPPDTLALPGSPDLDLASTTPPVEQSAKLIEHAAPAPTSPPVVVATPSEPVAAVMEAASPVAEPVSLVAEKATTPKPQEPSAAIVVKGTAAPLPEKTPQASIASAPEPIADGKSARKEPVKAITPQPVVFPVLHAPDDPGVDEAATKRKR